MTSDIVALIYTRDDTQLVKIAGRPVPIGRGWQRDMPRAVADGIVAARPEMFKIEEVHKN